METLIVPGIQEVTKQTNYFPSVTIILPFNAKMTSKAMLNKSLKKAISKVEWEVYENYSSDMAELVIQKLESIVSNLNFGTHTISIVIYVSPVFEKVLYLDIPVEENIIVDESFRILDLLHSKKQLRKYIVLLLSDRECRIYLGSPEGLVKILSNTPESAHSCRNKASVTFQDCLKEICQRQSMDEFLCYNDNVLDIILNAYPLPLFVLGVEEIIDRFKSTTKHSSAVIEYAPGNFEDYNLEQLKEIVRPYIVNWKKVKQREISNQLKEADGKMKLAVGIRQVYQEAMNYRGRLLVVDKNYMHATNQSVSNLRYQAAKKYSKFSNIKNPLDEAIEKVLVYGGNVELVDGDVLRCYDHIALIK